MSLVILSHYLCFHSPSIKILFHKWKTPWSYERNTFLFNDIQMVFNEFHILESTILSSRFCNRISARKKKYLQDVFLRVSEKNVLKFSEGIFNTGARKNVLFIWRHRSHITWYGWQNLIKMVKNLMLKLNDRNWSNCLVYV